MGIENMKVRIRYRGGARTHDRMVQDKLKSLKYALDNSYQAATAILSDNREFKCLINRDKLSLDVDDKILSIPFEDICLTSQIIEETGIKEGDVIEWKENGSHWLVFLQHLEEVAYFRASLRRCKNILELNGKKYYVYLRGPVEQNILWAQKSNNYYNKLNYSLIMYLGKTEETEDYFHRFTKVKIDGKDWEVQAVDSISTPGILQISLKEAYSNTVEENIDKAVEDSKNIENIPEQEGTYIYGETKIYPYDVKTYEIKNYTGSGAWQIVNTSRKNMLRTVVKDKEIKIEILTGKSGNFTLEYIDDNKQVIAALNIEIGSL